MYQPQTIAFYYLILMVHSLSSKYLSFLYGKLNIDTMIQQIHVTVDSYIIIKFYVGNAFETEKTTNANFLCLHLHVKR